MCKSRLLRDIVQAPPHRVSCVLPGWVQLSPEARQPRDDEFLGKKIVYLINLAKFSILACSLR
jgi:hypothetical protein